MARHSGAKRRGPPLICAAAAKMQPKPIRPGEISRPFFTRACIVAPPVYVESGGKEILFMGLLRALALVTLEMSRGDGMD